MKQDYECTTKEPLKLYKIGIFSQITRVTVKTLRYYDDIDLLKPELVDEENGYRYYTSSQLPRLHKILALREMDFTIAEIKQVMDGVSEEKLLQKKKCELMKMYAEISKKLSCIESYLQGDYLNSEYRIIIKSLPEVIVAYKEVHLDSYAQLVDVMPAMGLDMEKAGCECTEIDYCYVVYHGQEFQKSDINAQTCEAVTELKEDHGDLKFKIVPEVPTAACVLHKGPYKDLPKAYQAVVRFIEENDYEIIGEQRESYIDGMWNKDSENEWLTEIQFPIRKISIS